MPSTSSRVFIEQCIDYSAQCTVHSLQCTAYSAQFTLHSLHCTAYSAQFQCTSYSVLFLLPDI